VSYGFSVIDEALASEFGAYPYDYRGMLGAPRRGIAMLEIGQLEGALEASLRDPRRRDTTLNQIAARVVKALQDGQELAAKAAEPTAVSQLAKPDINPRE